MSQLADVSCVIKVIDGVDGKAVPDGGAAFVTRDPVTVRYVVVNDSNKPAGPFSILGRLFSDGVPVKPPGQMDVVPAQQITLPPRQMWKKEYTIAQPLRTTDFIAVLVADSQDAVLEETEANNHFKTTFQVVAQPR